MTALLRSLFLLAATLSAAAPAPAQSTRPVTLELVLAVDISASVSAAEYRLQMDAIAAAFRDDEVAAAIEAQGPHGIAVTLMHWSATSAQVLG